MRAVIQRVSRASVTVNGNVTGAIGRGIVILLGIGKGDQEKDADFLLDKIYNLRIFPDEQDKMNLSAADVGASLLVVSQFTLLGDCRKGRRPSFDSAAPPAEAKRLYEYFIAKAQERGIPVATGIFQASMQVELVNDGPVTFILESPNSEN
ncbi:MAG: D-aminoacyl-tRNA deacylase [Bryobacteraceae bacterium]|nr:D-aminoacyl-tRNA deacylase [Bryobacteraceae bacterium]MDW8378632.1 D-aminoacyl-tRNA deacylase [Bryobacterales bacterium]